MIQRVIFLLNDRVIIIIGFKFFSFFIIITIIVSFDITWTNTHVLFRWLILAICLVYLFSTLHCSFVYPNYMFERWNLYWCWYIIFLSLPSRLWSKFELPRWDKYYCPIKYWQVLFKSVFNYYREKHH